MENNLAAIYVRVSTLKDSQKDSPEHQKAYCLEKAKVEGLEAPFIYEDKSTGTSIVQRDDIKELLADAQKGLFSTVIFASLSRFSRDSLDAIILKRKLVNALGIRLISIDDTYDSKEKDDEMLFTIISAVNQKLSEQISLSSRRGIRQSAMSGNFTGSFPPFGYKKVTIEEDNKKRKLLKMDEKNASIVQQIFEWYCYQGMGEKQIVNELNAMEIPSPRKKGPWGVTSVQRILQNPVYTGKNVFGKYTTKKHYDNIDDMQNRRMKLVQVEQELWNSSEGKAWEPIIDDETFKKSQEMRLKRGGGKRGGVRNIKANAFAGIVQCAHCGSSYTNKKSGKVGKKGQEYRYLMCSRRSRMGPAGCENGLWIQYDKFRDALINELTLFLKDAIQVEDISQKVEIPTYNIEDNSEKDLKKYKELINQTRYLLADLRKDKKLGEIDEGQYQFEKEKYEKEIEEFEKKLKAISPKKLPEQDKEKTREEIKKALEELQKLNVSDVAELQFILKQLIDRIDVHQDGNVDIYTPLGKL